MTNSKRFTTLLLITILIFCTTSVFGQGIVTGSISGVVQDAQKAVIAGAKVAAKNLGTGAEYSTTSNEVGFFTIRNLPIGDYDIVITKDGFRKLKVAAITVAVSRDTNLGVQAMMVGGDSQTVTVEGSAPLVDTTAVQMTTAFDEKRITDMPVNNGFDSLALFSPGVVSTGQGRFGNTNGPNISVNGQRSRSNNFQIDGQGNNDPSVTGPSIFLGNQDIIAEYQVTTNFGAEYGRNTGGVVNYVTKSGTNAIHGTGFWFYTPSTFDALGNTEKSPLFGWCQPGQNPDVDGCSKPERSRYVENRWGGTLGGPIVKDKAWFFGSYMEDPIRYGNTPSSATVYTFTPAGLQQLRNNFPNAPGLNFLTTLAPAAYAVGNPRFDSIRTMPITYGGTTQSIEVGKITRFMPSLYNDREITGRVDYQITQKDHFFGRYVFQKNISTVAAGSVTQGQWVDVPGIDQQIGLDWVHTISDTFTNQLRFSYSRANFGWEKGANPDCTMIGMDQCPTSVTILAADQQNFGLGNTYPQGRITNNYQIQDNATKVYSKHTFKFGGEYDRQRVPSTFLANYNGSYTFADYSAVLSNTITAFSLTDGPSKLRFKENDFSFYVQDDWRFRTNLTISLGLRYELYGQAINSLHDYTVGVQKSANPFWDPNLSLDRTTVRYIPIDKNNFGPVVGFSYSPGNNGKTVIRGGFRLAYDAPFQNMYSNVGGAAPVVNAASNLTPTSTPGITLPTTGVTGADVRAANLALIPHGAGIDPGLRSQTIVAPNFHNPYSEQWNIGVQRYLTSKIAVEARYVGSHSVGSFQTINGNPYVRYYDLALANNQIDRSLYDKLVPAGVTACADPTAPGFGYVDCTRRSVTERGNFGSSKYNGLQTAFRVKGWHGVSADFGYTHAQNMDTNSEAYNSATVGMLAFNPDSFFPVRKKDYSKSAIDYPNVATIMLTYEFPWYKKQQGILGRILGGWQTNTTWRYSSGEVYTPIQRKASGSASACDPSNIMSSAGGTDMCRPIEVSPNAPWATYAYLTYSPTTGAYSLYRYGNSTPVATTSAEIQAQLSNFHWLRNDLASMRYFGDSAVNLGTRRNLWRGDTINNMNFSMFKNTKLTERFNLQLQVNVFNLMNRMYLGTPDNALVDVPLTTCGSSNFGTNNCNASGAGVVNGQNDGIGPRRLMFGAKVSF